MSSTPCTPRSRDSRDSFGRTKFTSWQGRGENSSSAGIISQFFPLSANSSQLTETEKNSLMLDVNNPILLYLIRISFEAQRLSKTWPLQQLDLQSEETIIVSFKIITQLIDIPNASQDRHDLSALLLITSIVAVVK